MNQSNLIFFGLFLAFVIYITMRGELPTYMGFFVPNTRKAQPLTVNPGTPPELQNKPAFPGSQQTDPYGNSRSTPQSPGLFGQTKPFLDFGPFGTLDPRWN